MTLQYNVILQFRSKFGQVLGWNRSTTVNSSPSSAQRRGRVP